MNFFTNVAAAAVVATFSAGFASATTVTTGTFFDSTSITLENPDDVFTASYELDFSTTFDVAFSGTGLTSDVSALSYSIYDADDLSIIASGTFDEDSGSLTSIDELVTFTYDSDFIVSVTAVGLSQDFSLTATVLAPSTAVPLPAGVFLLGGALGALGIARRKKA